MRDLLWGSPCAVPPGHAGGQFQAFTLILDYICFEKQSIFFTRHLAPIMNRQYDIWRQYDIVCLHPWSKIILEVWVCLGHSRWNCEVFSWISPQSKGGNHPCFLGQQVKLCSLTLRQFHILVEILSFCLSFVIVIANQCILLYCTLAKWFWLHHGHVHIFNSVHD
jgi:hypothetical protein